MNGFIRNQRKKGFICLVFFFFFMLSYVELTVVYPLFLLPAFFNLFIYLFCLIMLTCYDLISSELSVKVDIIN